METYFSGLSFHIYITDYDRDGYLDFVLPNQVTNELSLVKNPGGQYWSKVQSIKDKMSIDSKEKIQNQIAKSVDKWQSIRLVESSYSISVRDFVFVNIDSEEKLAIVLLASDSIRKYIHK